VERRDPHRPNAEVGKVIGPPRKAKEIAYTVPIAVLERPQIDLVNDTRRPPRSRGSKPATCSAR
jgi:hypothetical protein